MVGEDVKTQTVDLSHLVLRPGDKLILHVGRDGATLVRLVSPMHNAEVAMFAQRDMPGEPEYFH